MFMSPAKMLITGEVEANSDFEQWWDDENAELFCWSYDRGYLILGLGTLCTQATDGISSMRD